MLRLNRVPILIAVALSSLLSGDAQPTDGSQSQEIVRSLAVKSRTDAFLQPLGRGQTWIIQVVSYKFAPQVRVHEMGTADPSVRGVARGQLIASSLDGETGRRETANCQAFAYKDDRGNTVFGTEVQLNPRHNGPYIIEVTGAPTMANTPTKTLDYRIVIDAEETTTQDVLLPPVETDRPRPPDWATRPSTAAQVLRGMQSSKTASEQRASLAKPDRAQFPPSPNNTSQPTAEEMLTEGEQLMRALGLLP